MMTETTYDRVFIDGTAELLPNYTLENALYRNFAEIGVPAHSEEEIAFASPTFTLFSRYAKSSAARALDTRPFVGFSLSIK